MKTYDIKNKNWKTTVSVTFGQALGSGSLTIEGNKQITIKRLNE